MYQKVINFFAKILGIKRKLRLRKNTLLMTYILYGKAKKKLSLDDRLIKVLKENPFSILFSY